MDDMSEAFHLTATELVRRFRQLRTLVVGDAMLDTYMEGQATRLCREGPVPVVRKVAKYHLPGGAANTAANVKALGADVTFLSVIGNDIAGSQLRTSLREQGISDQWIVTDDQVETLHKLRVRADGQYVVRFDEGEQPAQPSSNATYQQRVLDNLSALYPQCDLIIVSDYGYGVVSDMLIEHLRTLQASETSSKILLIDAKTVQKFHGVKATVIAPNRAEARRFLQQLTAQTPDQQTIRTDEASAVDLKEVETIARQLHTHLDVEHIAITMAEQGVFLLDRQGRAAHLPTQPVTNAHDVGAGDSFISAMALALAAGGSVKDAAQIGIDASGIAVTRERTAVVHYHELLQRVSLREYASYQVQTSFAAQQRDAHATIAQLAELLETERLDGRTIVFTNGVFDILHAGHVQLLRQAKELGDVLVVGLNSDSSVRRLKGNGRPINNEKNRMALVAALDMVDYVALFDEDTPSELIRTLKPHIHAKGGDYADKELPEAEAVCEVGARTVILPLAGRLSTSNVIARILALASEQPGQDGARHQQNGKTRAHAPLAQGESYD